MDVLLKKVERNAWTKFKIAAIRRNKKLGELFNDMVKKIENPRNNWDEIKKSKGCLTNKEAEEIKKSIKDFRENFNFRY